MSKIENKKNGFTLIEVIVSLVLLGIIGTMVGMGIVNIAKSYITSSKNLDMAQKGTLVLSRLVKELSEAKSITAATATASSITYTRVDNVTNTISVTAPNLLLNNADILTDQVSSFTLTYYNTYNSPASAFNASTTIIGINLVLIPQTGMTASFTDRIYIIRPYNI
jgi:prepilin-type N-terminal cleavage/methylation domain-containing protein